MKKSMKVLLTVVMSLVLLAPTSSIFAAEQRSTTNNIATPNLIYQNNNSCTSNQVEGSGKATINMLPGDYTRGCKIVKTEKRDNVRYTNWENKLIPFILSGALGTIGNYIAPGPLKAFVWSGVTGIYVSYPKNKPLYVTIQHRECKDMLGYHQYLIIKYYKDKKRNKFITIEMKKLS
ncbi:hypothetical protein [Bacillus changyiensis]|uniref:hypothetical protein n=1 Tax=Bacillus changyiensis TaxID=3004103 RepID=UPI0022E42F27|nr:hypothetical protein [Bacillus changyiensis]MDA1478376.1 hypothetical protein [Bacillus changyiensis]